MDSTRFDNMTRLFGAGTSRRRVLRGLIGGAGAMAVAGTSHKLTSAAPDCRTFGEVCQLNPGQGNNCCEGLDCSDPGAGHGICECPSGTEWCAGSAACLDPNTQCCIDEDCDSTPCSSCVGNACTPYAEYCPDGDYCYNTGTGGCCTDENCGDQFCIDRVCSPCPSGMEYCEATESCYSPSTGGCCTDSDCGDCGTCSGGACKPITNCCVDSGDCPPCNSCQGDRCVPYAEYCPETEECYNRNIGECCSDDDCGDEDCIDGHCCPPGYKYCPDGDICYTDRQGECCTDDECSTACDDHHHCVECPSDEIWCARTQKCVNLEHECCADSDCIACNTCGENNQCTEVNCCDSNDDCYSDEVCCSGICVDEEIGCCRQLGDYCGVVDVTSAGGDDRQYDCCDGLLCCFGQSTNVCGECCADSDCTEAPGGVCNGFICEYPTCDGKWEACDADSDCCHGLKCYGGVCKSKHHHHPHPKPKPPTPAPDQPVTTLPATGAKSGKNDSSSALGMTLATGAAALLAAKYLRQNSEDEATEEA